MIYKIEATIPTTQYGNIRPSFEIEDSQDETVAFDTLKSLWQRFGDSPLKDKSNGGVKVKSFTGEELMYNDTTHVYTDMAGNKLVSGSEYSEKNSPKFDMEQILPKTATSWGVDQESLRDVWKMNSDISLHFGSAVHKSLELMHKHGLMGMAISGKKELPDNYVLPKNKFLASLVDDFITKFGVDAEVEVLVSDVANGMAGTIDRLANLGDGTYRVGDYKTNAEMDSKKKLKYQKQLSFYAHILTNKGFNVGGLDLFYIGDDGWVKEELEILPLE